MRSGPLLATLCIVLLAAAGGYWAGHRSGGATAVASNAQAERKPLYYRNPMGLADTSPTPKKDSMGMDYIPVYAEDSGETPAVPGQLTISPDKVQKLGVRSEAARRELLDKTLHVAGRIEPDERRLYAVAPKFEGYVERLLVSATGQPVSKGQALFEAYSPELFSAQREYALAAHGVETLAGDSAQDGMRQLAAASLSRLRNWDISEAQVDKLSRSGTAQRTLTFRSPVNGVITEKKAVQGMRFQAGDTLYQVADLSSVWVLADVFEQNLAAIHAGQDVHMRVDAYPGQNFGGRVAYVYPTLNAETRSIPVRIELPNPGGRLKPGMYAQVDIPLGNGQSVLSIPNSAVIDSGTRRVVFVETGEGRYEPRPVRLGRQGETRVEVLEGVSDGERVVVAANFLLDAESNLQAALSGFAPSATSQAGVGYRASGKVDAVDAAAGTVTISHGPVAGLDWPAMTMEFRPANSALLSQMRPGAGIAFEFVERSPGEWVITSVTPNGGR